MYRGREGERCIEGLQDDESEFPCRGVWSGWVVGAWLEESKGWERMILMDCANALYSITSESMLLLDRYLVSRRLVGRRGNSGGEIRVARVLGDAGKEREEEERRTATIYNCSRRGSLRLS